jgi:hypothetical protein
MVRIESLGYGLLGPCPSHLVVSEFQRDLSEVEQRPTQVHRAGAGPAFGFQRRAQLPFGVPGPAMFDRHRGQVVQHPTE